MDAVEIKYNNTSFILGPISDDYLMVKFESYGLQANNRIYIYYDGEALSIFFNNMLANYKGWDGSKIWRSVENDLIIEATHNRLSHVNLKVLIATDQGLENNWSIEGNIQIELGNLGNIAEQVRILTHKR